MIETGIHRGENTVVEAGMGSGATNGRIAIIALPRCVLSRLFADKNTTTLKNVRPVRLRKSVPKPKKRLAKSQS